MHLWNGSLSSSFVIDSQTVTVHTAVHSELDALAVQVCSPLVATGSVGVGLAFPYASTAFAGGTDWSVPGRHESSLVPGHPGVINHTLDNTTYFVHTTLSSGAQARPGAAPHDWIIASADNAQCLALTLWFSLSLQPPHSPPPSAHEVFRASASAWPQRWLSGAALDLSGSTADGARELERRVVLSQYILMSQEAGSNPPQETGLMTNSWYGTWRRQKPTN